jgi:hypothetical protein
MGSEHTRRVDETTPLDASALARAVPHGVDPSRLVRVLESAGVSSDQLEASVRHRPPMGLSGRRVMVELAPANLLDALAASFGVALGEGAAALVAAAKETGLPLILGWDGRGDGPWLKIYLNGSDASDALRRRASDLAGFGDVSALPNVPHIVAMNVGRGGLERKAYLQRPDAMESAGRHGPAAIALARAALERELCAGAVECWDLGAAPAPRAWFVALSDEHGVPAEALLATLEGFAPERVGDALPFERGHCRSVGVPAGAASISHWTAYFKPRAQGVPLFRLAPIASFRAAEDELSVHVTPVEHTKRAYARTRRWAVSFRARQGRPAGPDAERLMDWVVRRLFEAEVDAANANANANANAQATELAEALANPPPPWARVE